MNEEVEQGIERFGGLLEWRPRPTPGCSAIEEEESISLVNVFNIYCIQEPPWVLHFLLKALTNLKFSMFVLFKF
jgi:hypothetical protein